MDFEYAPILRRQQLVGMGTTWLTSFASSGYSFSAVRTCG